MNNPSMQKKTLYFLIFFLISISILLPSNIRAQNNDYLTFAVGSFDFNKKVNTSIFGRIEYRFGKKLLFLNPFTGVMVNSDSGVFIFGGITFDIPIGDFILLIPSFAPGYYNKGNSKELFHALEFRSKIELAISLKNNLRVGVSFSHISNASLGPPNPGAENYAFNISIPL